ncbi:hypothetical protein [Nonomuraea salmonea]|uniref:hypothetical protein n=1 Tax=Nonomuraea salmonea TaxID=46181 RepID=UPI002FE7DA49
MSEDPQPHATGLFPHPQARLIAAGDRDGVAGEDLARAVRRAAGRFGELPPGPVFCGMRNTPASVFCYLGGVGGSAAHRVA